jgi:hypothetical protein
MFISVSLRKCLVYKQKKYRYKAQNLQVIYVQARVNALDDKRLLFRIIIGDICTGA